MKIKFWGVRGSIPTPLTPAQLKNKITAVVHLMTPDDARDNAHRQAFLAKLPPSLIRTIGGNTSCVEIGLDDDSRIIIDAGTGIRELGSQLQKKKGKNQEFHFLFTHFHWDHLQGLPFFDPAYVPENRLFFYSHYKECEDYLQGQMKNPYFPIPFESMGAQQEFITIPEEDFTIGNATISWRTMKHPGGSVSYKIVKGESQFVFATDVELRESDFKKSEENRRFFEGIDCLVVDSQYTLNEAIERYNWGHSSYSLAVDFAAAWKIPKLGLFHHEPKHNDDELYHILHSAKKYLRHQKFQDIEIFLVTEGFELSL